MKAITIIHLYTLYYDGGSCENSRPQKKNLTQAKTSKSTSHCLLRQLLVSIVTTSTTFAIGIGFCDDDEGEGDVYEFQGTHIFVFDLCSACSFSYCLLIPYLQLMIIDAVYMDYSFTSERYSL